MSSEVTIPPRPRPGRKPIPQENAADRRRLQNRIAQRNFRDKRQQKLVETQIELEEKKKDYQERINELERQLEVIRQKKKALEEDNLKLGRRASDAEKRAQQAESKLQGFQTTQVPGLSPFARSSLQAPFTAAELPTLNTRFSLSSRPYVNSDMMTPPDDNSNEIDYTYWNSSQASISNFRPVASSDIGASQAVDFTMGGVQSLDDNCGFCTDDQNCSCKQEKRVAEIVAAPGPGSCEACQHDPVKAQACRELAAQTQMAPRPSTANGSRLYDGTEMAMVPLRVSCSSIIDRFRLYNVPISSASERSRGRLHAWPVATGGYEIEEHEAAQVLQSLSRRNTVVSQPESNERAR